MESTCKFIFVTGCLVVTMLLLVWFCSCSEKHKKQNLKQNGVEQVKDNNGATYNIVRFGNHQYIENELSSGKILIHYEDCDCKKLKFDPRYIPDYVRQAKGTANENESA